MQINVAVTDANNIVCTVVPPQVQTITIDRGVAGNGIVSIVPVTISTFQYLRITYTNGTISDVGPLTSTAYTATAPINITGNTISLLTVPIAVGGTGAVTAAAAIQNLLPSYTANGNKRLGLNAGATALEWVADGGGTVTSVAVSGGSTGLTTSGGPITGSGTITLAGTLAIANGGSGQTTAQAAMNAFAGAVTSGSYLRGDGTNVVMSGIQVGDVPTLNQNTTGNAANVTGIVAIVNGGTGQTTANTALNALLPVQTGNATKYLQTDGTNASWDAISLSTADITGVLPTANGGTGLSAFTANQVFYASSTSAIAQSSNLQFNGTMLTAGSITNLALTPGRVTYTGSGNILTDSANLTFNGTNLSLAAGIANRVAYLNASKVLTTDDSFSIVNGQVGIGTVTPNNTLQVSGVLGAGITIGSGVNGTSGQLIIDSGTDGSSSSSIFGRGNGLNEWFVGSLRAFTGSGALGMVDYVYGSNPRVFYTNGIERMRILGSGNVGIGTTSPTATLDVNGNLAITGAARRIIGDFSNATLASRVMFQSSTTNGQTSIGVLPNGTSTSANLNLFGGNDPANASIAQFVNTGTEVRLGALITGTGTYLPTTFYTGGSERLRIDTSGNVGIGTSSPGVKLDVNGALRVGVASNPTTIANNSQFYDQSLIGPTISGFNFEVRTGNPTPVARMIINTDGNVGIGTSSPGYRLEVNSGSGAFSARLTSTTTNALLLFGDSATTGAGPFAGSSGNNLTFGRAGVAEYMRIDTSGNVGIGTSSPASKLHVFGVGTTSTSYTNGDATGATLFLQDLNGTSGNGGQLLFGASQGSYAGIKGFITNGTGPAGDLLFQTRASTGNIVERMRINSAGDIGVGTAFPTFRLVAANSAFDGGWLYSTGAVSVLGLGGYANAVDGAFQIRYDRATGNITFNGGSRDTPLERIRINNSGNVGIGTSSPTARLDINNQDALNTFPLALSNNIVSIDVATVGIQFNAHTVNFAQVVGGQHEFGSYATGNLRFFTRNAEAVTEKMRIDPGGNLLVNTTSAASGGKVVINQGSSGYLLTATGGTLTGSQAWRHWLNTSSYFIINDANTGVYLAYGGTSWTANSDERLKDIIEPIADAANKVSSLRAVIGKYKADKEGTRRSFLIAQDVQAVLPEAVAVGIDDMLGIQYTEVIPLLVAAIKEQQAIIQTLTARVAALESN
jgi:hypothetical protein